MKLQTFIGALGLLAPLIGGCTCKAPVRDQADAQPATAVTTRAAMPPALGWIADDYPLARQRALAAGKPLLIDMWAGWCHTCLSMKRVVLPDPKLRPTLERFVRLALDTERPDNAAALERFAVSAWPTFFVVDPRDQRIAARYQGAASREQLARFLAAADKTYQRARQSDKAGSDAGSRDPLILASEGDRAAAAAELPRAEAAYSKALALAPAAWSRRPGVLVSLIGVRYKAKRDGDCVDLALASAHQTGKSASAADFLYYATTCAGRLPASDPRQAALRQLAKTRLTALVDDEQAELSVDDHSDALRILRLVHEALGEKATALRTATRQRRLLDQAAAAAKTPADAAIYNWPRAEVYTYLGQGAELVGALEASARALPSDYDPPYRLAWVLHKIGRPGAALAAAKRALGLAYGPRKARIRALVTKIEQALAAKPDAG